LRIVTEEYDGFRWNTMVAHLMELANLLMRYRGTEEIGGGPAYDEAIRLLLLMLAPAAPHISEELWSRRLTTAGEPGRSIPTGGSPAGIGRRTPTGMCRSRRSGSVPAAPR